MSPSGLARVSDPGTREHPSQSFWGLLSTELLMPNATQPLTVELEQAFERLARRPIGGYHAEGESASEPTAWATLALARVGEASAAVIGAEWLAEQQASDGSVGVTESQAEPFWPTALAMLAWREVDAVRYANQIAAGAEWAFAQEPWTTERHPTFGHDTGIAGWSWAPDTHSWLEPTAFFSVALRETGHADHPRRHEAVRLLIDRLLPSGGANYGNTTVFGQELLQHVHSSGVVAWALAGEAVEPARLAPTLDYLAAAVQKPTGLASLAWAARGLAAWGLGTAAEQAMAAAWKRVEQADSLHKTALFALALQEATANSRLAEPLA